MDYYEVLELDPHASTDDIERAFRRLARKVHPDLNSGAPAQAEARMKQLNEIRDTLTDPLLRAGYDERLRLEAEQRERRGPAPARPAPRRSDAEVYMHPLGQPAPRPSAPPRRVFALALLGGAAASAIFVSLPDGGGGPSAPHPAASLPDAATAPLLTVPTTAGARVPPEPARAATRGRRHVRLGSTVDEVFAAFGAPARIEPGRRTGDATFHYGTLRLAITNGRVTGGDAAAFR